MGRVNVRVVEVERESWSEVGCRVEETGTVGGVLGLDLEVDSEGVGESQKVVGSAVITTSDFSEISDCSRGRSVSRIPSCG